MTDAEVAGELVVSRRTVHAHLRSIYGKLGVRTRAATRCALEHDPAELPMPSSSEIRQRIRQSCRL